MITALTLYLMSNTRDESEVGYFHVLMVIIAFSQDIGVICFMAKAF